jgi:steroid delta-isomerase-like uncharacterized protein
LDVHRSKHEAFSRGDFEAMASVFAESATYTDRARGIVLHGREAIMEHFAGWKTAFSDAHITDADYFESENATVSRFIGRGTNDGPLGDLPATGRSVASPQCDIYEFDSDGRVARAEIYYDQLSILQQLGHVSQPEPARV